MSCAEAKWLRSLSCAKLKFYSRRVVGGVCVKHPAKSTGAWHKRLHKIFESIGVAKFQPRTLAGRSVRASSRRCCSDLA